jgi:WD40 repeat protein
MRGTIGIAVVAVLVVGCTGTGGAAPSASSVAATATPAVTSAPVTTLAGRLLFSRFTEATHSFDGMFTSRPDGSDETGIPMPWTEGGGRWSTSGTEIAVATQVADGRVGTAILDANGTVLRVLGIPDPTLNLPCVVWSPDDTRLACFAWDDTDASRGGIYTVLAADGGDLQRLTTPPAGMIDEPGDFSSSGEFVFKRMSSDEGPGPLMLIDAAGGDPRPLSDDQVEGDGRFSPDGTSIATAARGRIIVLGLDGTTRSAIEHDGRFLFGPSWSPDGDYLAYSGTSGGFFSDIFISRPDGSDLRQVTTTEDNEITVEWGVGPT